jgi:riboflavin synthase
VVEAGRVAEHAQSQTSRDRLRRRDDEQRGAERRGENRDRPPDEDRPVIAPNRGRRNSDLYAGWVFTGLVREVGTVRSMAGGRLVVESSASAELGDSVAIDGVCLTVVAAEDGTLAFDAVPETLARTSLGTLDHGSRVNLEPALRAGDPLGGHYVQGHVDGVGAVRSIEPEGDGKRIWFDAPPEILRYVVEKGSIAVQGTSLTVAGVDEAGFAVALIPHTLRATTLGALVPGAAVNLETDVLAKYVEKLVRR